MNTPKSKVLSLLLLLAVAASAAATPSSPLPRESSPDVVVYETTVIPDPTMAPPTGGPTPHDKKVITTSLEKAKQLLSAKNHSPLRVVAVNTPLCKTKKHKKNKVLPKKCRDVVNFSKAVHVQPVYSALYAETVVLLADDGQTKYSSKLLSHRKHHKKSHHKLH